MGCPIRTPRDQRPLAAPPRFSQRATSFIASWCQGIHQMPFSYSNPHTQNPATNHSAAQPRACSQRKNLAMHRNHPHPKPGASKSPSHNKASPLSTHFYALNPMTPVKALALTPAEAPASAQPALGARHRSRSTPPQVRQPMPARHGPPLSAPPHRSRDPAKPTEKPCASRTHQNLIHNL